MPGVTGSGLALYNPLTDNWGELILVSGHPAPKMNGEAGASWDRVSADYLQNLGVTLTRGRYFARSDNETTEPVAIVNETFVKRFFKSDEDPLGQHFGLDLPENAGTFRIVGIVRDAKFAGFALRRPARPMFYVPLAQNVPYKDPLMKRVELQSHFIGGLLLVTNISPGALEPLLTRILAGVDPNLTINSVRTLQHQVELTFDQERAVASLAGLFGFVALLLAAVGLYGVTAYTVAQRTNEIGIRMALGADRTKVVQYILRGALIHVAAGLATGNSAGHRRGTVDLEPAIRSLLLGPGRAGRSGRSAGDLRRCGGYDSSQRGRVDFAHECAQSGIMTGLPGAAPPSRKR